MYSMAKVSTGPRPAPSHRETAGPDSISRAPPAAAWATHPMRGIGPRALVIAASRSSATARKWAEANSTASAGGGSPSAWGASSRPWIAASRGPADWTRAPPAFTPRASLGQAIPLLWGPAPSGSEGHEVHAVVLGR